MKVIVGVLRRSCTGVRVLAFAKLPQGASYFYRASARAPFFSESSDLRGVLCRFRVVWEASSKGFVGFRYLHT